MVVAAAVDNAHIDPVDSRSNRVRRYEVDNIDVGYDEDDVEIVVAAAESLTAATSVPVALLGYYLQLKKKKAAEAMTTAATWMLFLMV